MTIKGPLVPGYDLPSDYYGPPVAIGNGWFRPRRADDSPIDKKTPAAAPDVAEAGAKSRR